MLLSRSLRLSSLPRLAAARPPLPSSPLLLLCREVSTYGSLDSPLVTPVFIDAALSELLKNKKAKRSDINQFIDHFKTKMNRQNFVNLLHGCRRRRVLEPRHVYTAARGLKFPQNELEEGKDGEEGGMSARQLEQLFHSLSFLSHRVGAVRVLVGVAAEEAKKCTQPLSSQQLAKFFFSFVQMKSGVPEVREVLHVLVGRLAAGDDKISNESASMLIGSFRGFSSKYPEIRQALAVVVDQIEKRNDSGPFTAEEWSCALYGMRRLSSSCGEVQSLTSYVMTKAPPTESINSVQISKAMFAVQCMEADSEESKNLFRFLTKQIVHLSGNISVGDAQELTASLEHATTSADIVDFCAALNAKSSS